MNKKKYNHVGRPSNKEINTRKRKRHLVVIIIFILLMLVPTVAYLTLNENNIVLSLLMGDSTTKGDFKLMLNNKKITTISLMYKEQKQLTVPKKYAKEEVKWESEDSNIVSVDKDTGIITARDKNIGMTKIYAITESGKKGILIVKVYPTGEYANGLKNVSETLKYNRDYYKYKTHIKLNKNAVMQSFAIAGDYLYFSQQQGKSSGARLSKVAKDSVVNTTENAGQYLGDDFAVLKDYGHVANIDIETTNGVRYLWTQCSTTEAGAAHCRVPLNDIEFDGKRDNLQTPKSVKKFTGASLVAVDPHNDILVTMVGMKNQNFKVYNLKDYINKNGKSNSIYSFTIKNPNKKYSRQGFDVDGNYIYSYEGNISSSKYPGIYISVFTLDGKEVIYRKKVNYPNTTANWEPEGIKVYNGHLYIGMARQDIKTGKKTQYIFRVGKDDVIS